MTRKEGLEKEIWRLHNTDLFDPLKPDERKHLAELEKEYKELK